MKIDFIRVTECRRLYGDTYILWFDSAPVLRGAVAGQFLMLRCADLVEPVEAVVATNGFEPYLPTGADLLSDPLLPRAMSYHRIRQGESGREFSILFDVVGRGTAWLAERRPGDRVFAWGPLGKGYSIRPDAGNLLLIGGGIGIAPLLWLAEEGVAKGRSVVLVCAARTANGIFPADLIPAEVEVVVATDDGSAGRKGRATEPFAEYFEWADQVFACGPNPMFAAMAEVVRQQEAALSIRARAGTGAGRGKPVQVLLESPMACGTGICYGCAVMDRKGDPRLVCKEGPRFDIRDIW